MADEITTDLYHRLKKSKLGKLAIGIGLLGVVGFAIWSSLPEQTKIEIIASFTGKKSPAPSPTPEPPPDIEKKAETVAIWSQGKATLLPGNSYDLDLANGSGSFERADLFYENVNGVERYLRSARSMLAKGGTKAFDAVTLADVKGANFGSGRFDARLGGGEVLPGTVWFVFTSERRFAKVRILQEGRYLKFEWVVFAQPGEGSLPSAVQSGPSSIEDELMCGAGGMAGDEIKGFRLENFSPKEATLRVSLNYHSSHGQVYIVAYLLDKNGENLSGGHKITRATQGESVVTVLYGLPGRAQSAELLVYLYESGRPAEAFACRRFPFSRSWGTQ